MSSVSSSSSSSSSTVSSTGSYLNLNLTEPSVFHGPIIGFLTDTDLESLTFCDNLSQGICEEIHDNVQNGTMSKNALEFRCKVFGSIFGRVAKGPKGKRKAVSAGGLEDDEEDTRRDEIPKIKAPVKRMVGKPPPRTLPRLYPARPRTGAGVTKRRSTGRGMTPKRSYTWKDPERRNKTGLYEDHAREAGVSIEEYLAANNVTAEGSTTNNSENTNNSEESSDEEMKMEISSDEDDEMYDDNQQDDCNNDELFVNQARPPMMTDRRVAVLANQYFDNLFKLADIEPINDVSTAVKSALEKVKAGKSDQLNAVEQVELHLAVARYEATF